MKFAYFNPTVFAIEDVPPDIFVQLENIVNQAHEQSKFNDEGNPEISIRGGQQIQLLPNQFGLNVDVLYSYIEKTSNDYFDSILQVNGQNELSGYKSQLVSAWTIKQSEGDYQALHSHETHISGNIYIDVPDLNNDSKVSDGCLEFKIPVIKNPGTFHFVDTWRFKPQVMKMVIFPSYLSHTVYPWKGQGNRTILAWDVKLVKSS
jgi:hypothetical protein